MSGRTNSRTGASKAHAKFPPALIDAGPVPRRTNHAVPRIASATAQHDVTANAEDALLEEGYAVYGDEIHESVLEYESLVIETLRDKR